MSWRSFEHALDRWFPAGTNPLRHLGALACLALALLLTTGAWLFAVYDSSVAGAHPSVSALAAQPLAGGLVRGLHRYAGDALLIFVWLHLLREWALGRHRLFRRATWWTGLPLLPFLYIVAIGGFWLAWDRLAQYAAIASAQWLDTLPLVGGGFARQFDLEVPDRLFSLLLFVHTGVALLVVFALWFHLQRLARPALWPPRALALGTLGVLLALALLWPVRSGPPAELGSAPLIASFDWWLLHLLPLADATPTLAWLAVVAMLALLALAPLWPRAPAASAAVVDAENCNGCGRCVDDCPYVAVSLVTRTGGDALAVVDADLCAACGLCAGACPSATPFRSNTRLISGIDLPGSTVDALRLRLRAQLAARPAAVVVYACERGAGPSTDVAGVDCVWLPLACVGQLPPAFVDYALRQGATGVVVAACEACEFRLGERYARERLAGLREPRLRARVPTQRWRIVRAAEGEERQLTEVIDGLRRARG
ncbi:MAG: hydrogenase iron-sulfur subunit [Xanthomonadales bacterium]|nr:Cytochrome b6 [Xanthomonadales bacterium]MCC6592269.1 hydrogenase iron-sulfur subunit [Xanthomonadales bacterium]MCE7930665.1 hydrogenase iron-sulfur subunit [Xanthomonadales bacterium PRO6]